LHHCPQYSRPSSPTTRCLFTLLLLVVVVVVLEDAAVAVGVGSGAFAGFAPFFASAPHLKHRS
jgi:uncharacterized protein (DUF2062 family)